MNTGKLDNIQELGSKDSKGSKQKKDSEESVEEDADKF